MRAKLSTYVPFGVAAALLLISTAAPAQSLAQVSRQEQQRRKSAKTSTKVYTNADLQSDARLTTSASPSAPDAPSSAADAPADATTQASGEPAPESPRTGEDYWRTRITEARSQLARNQLLLDALETRVNGLWATFTAHDDPAQRAEIEQDRQAAQAEMERVQADIERLTREIADIRQEARRAGVPPGWLR